MCAGCAWKLHCFESVPVSLNQSLFFFCYCRCFGSPAKRCTAALTRKGPKIRVCISGRYWSSYLMCLLRIFMSVMTQKIQIEMLVVMLASHAVDKQASGSVLLLCAVTLPFTELC